MIMSHWVNAELLHCISVCSQNMKRLCVPRRNALSVAVILVRTLLERREVQRFLNPLGVPHVQSLVEHGTLDVAECESSTAAVTRRMRKYSRRIISINANGRSYNAAVGAGDTNQR